MNKFWLFSIGFFLAISPAFCFAQESADTPYNIEKIFYLPSFNAVKGVDSLNKNWDKIDILAPQAHTIIFDNNSAKIVGKFGPKLKEAISSHNVRVMPLITNANFSQSLMHKLLASDNEQNRVIAGLIYLAKREKYAGWQFDFENISYKDRDLFTAFVQKTYPLFKKNNLILSVAVISRTSDYANTNAFKNWGGVYDYEKIANSSDFISLMAYDDPNSLGPVASVDFINKALDYVKDKIPAKKLSLGVPLYYWKWNADTDKKLGAGLYKNVLAIMSNFKYSLDFDESLGVSCLTYSYDKKNYEIWFEDKNSLSAKLNIIKDNNLRGFSAWLLGGEDPGIWTILSKTQK